MLTEIRIYCEGHVPLRAGFGVFFRELSDRAKAKRCSFSLIAAGSGPTAIRDFGIALKTRPTAWNILLKDSEGPYASDLAASLCHQRGWNKSHADSIFWMVEMMESWFHADKNALAKFYGQEFNPKALKANAKVEQISKKDLVDGLRAATRNTKKGDYYKHKTSHGPQLLGSIRPDAVQAAAPNCKKLFAAIRAQLAD